MGDVADLFHIPQYIVVIVIIDAVICGILSAYLGSEKGYPGGSWFAVGFLFGVFGLITAAGLPMKSHGDVSAKKCPECVEMINIEASVCRYCGHRFSESDMTAAMEEKMLNGTYSEKCQAARGLINQGTVPGLINVIGNAPRDFSRRRASELLIAKADSSITPELIKILNENPEQIIALAVIRVLAKIKDVDAIGAIVGALARSELRNAVATRLEEIGEEAIPYLQEAVEQNAGIKKHAQKVIDRIQQAE